MQFKPSACPWLCSMACPLPAAAFGTREAPQDKAWVWIRDLPRDLEVSLEAELLGDVTAPQKNVSGRNSSL